MKVFRNPLFIAIIFILSILSQATLLAADTKINMNFKGADVRDVLRTIAELAKVNLVTDSSVSGEITIHLRNLSFQDALHLVTQVHGLAYKWYDNTVVVATPERIDELYSNIVVKTVDVKHADLNQTASTIIEIYPELSIVPDNRNNKLIFKGKVEDIVKGEELLSKLDTEKDSTARLLAVPVDRAEFLVNYLQRVYPELIIESDGKDNLVFYGSPANVESAGLLVSKLMEQMVGEGQSFGEVNVIESIRVNSIEVEYVHELVSAIYPEANIVADKKNNQLIFNGSKNDLERIKEVVRIVDLDRETGETVGGEGRATHIVQVDYSSLEELEGIIKDLYPEISFKINSQNKEVILTGGRDMVNEAAKLIKEIDIPRKQVIIEARIEEISTQDLLDLGVNLEQLSTISIIDQNEDGFIDGVGLTFPEVIRMLENKGASNTLARPRLMTLSGEEASLLIGDRIPVTVQAVDGGNVVTTVEYIEAGINLVFTPWVTSDNQINLWVHPQVSSIGESIGTTLPPINTREARTYIRLNDGETFAIGGLIQDDIIESVTKVPILGSIPILGNMFKSTTKQNLKKELVIFITPHIVKEEISEKEDDLKTREIISDSIYEEEEVVIDYKEQEPVYQEEQMLAEADSGKVHGPVENGENEETPIIQIVDDKVEKGQGEELQLLTQQEIQSILSQNRTKRQGNVVSTRPDPEEERKAEPVDNTLNRNENNFAIIVEETGQEEGSTDLEIRLEHLYLHEYTLKKAMTIDELAELFAVDWDLIIAANENISLSAGAVVKIPVEESRIYVMDKGDTLWRIRTTYGVSVEDIKILNNIDDETSIPVGTVIVLPE